MNEPKLGWTDDDKGGSYVELGLDDWYGPVGLSATFDEDEKCWVGAIEAKGFSLRGEYAETRQEAVLLAESILLEGLKPYVKLYDKLTNGEEKK